MKFRTADGKRVGEGDKVYWNDPFNDGACPAYCTVTGVASSEHVLLTNESGDHVECAAREIFRYRTMMLARSKWRDYVTPDDISAAIKEGIPQDRLHQEVLELLGQKRVENWDACAFVASRYAETLAEQRARLTPLSTAEASGEV